MKASYEWVLDEGKFLSTEEIGLVRRELKHRRDTKGNRVSWLEWFVVELGLETGLRVFEMGKLCCGDLFLESVRSGVLVREGKCGKRRFVLIRPEFVEVAKALLRWKQSIGESIDPFAPLIVSSKTGRNLTKRALQKMWERIRTRTGVHRIGIHGLRHTYAAAFLKASNWNLRLLQIQLGHSRITTTEVYAHVLNPEVSRALDHLYREASHEAEPARRSDKETVKSRVILSHLESGILSQVESGYQSHPESGYQSHPESGYQSHPESGYQSHP